MMHQYSSVSLHPYYITMVRPEMEYTSRVRDPHRVRVSEMSTTWNKYSAERLGLSTETTSDLYQDV